MCLSFGRRFAGTWKNVRFGWMLLLCYLTTSIAFGSYHKETVIIPDVGGKSKKESHDNLIPGQMHVTNGWYGKSGSGSISSVMKRIGEITWIIFITILSSMAW